MATRGRGVWTLAAGALALLLGGCHRSSVAPALGAGDRDRLYAAVLREIRRAPANQLIVVDTLLPADGLDDDVAFGLVESLSISRADVSALLLAQRRGGARVSAAMLPDAKWSTVSMRAIDSLRAVALQERVAAAPVAQARDAFWRHWNRAFPESGGYVILSPAGLSADGSMALVHVQHACGPLCGDAEVRLLRRDESGQWSTTRRVPISIS